MTKVCIITCYKDPDYVRSRSLRAALGHLEGVEPVVVKNRQRGLLRYPEVVLRTVWARLRYRPKVYLLTFRGYEILPAIRLVTLGRPLIFDEFINLVEWSVYEHGKIHEGSPAAKALHFYYRQLLKSVQLILTDTASHAAYSAELMRLPKRKFVDVPVGTDELVFKPGAGKRKHTSGKRLKVFYYGNMLPLHGLGVVIETALRLKDEPFDFRLVGGDESTAREVEEAIKQGAAISYDSFVPFEQLPEEAGSADVCLGGPFGSTLQAQMVITGKTYQFLAMGKPTIVGRNKDNNIFSDKKNALIVRQGDAEALKKALLWAAAHRDKLQDIGKSGRELFEKEFSAVALSDRLKRCLERVD